MMNIIRFRRKSNGKYVIYFDDGSDCQLCEEIILKYELLLKKNITQQQLNQIVSENMVWNCYYDALKLINKFPKTKKELFHSMQTKGYDKESCNFAIFTLEKQGYLNDANYAKSYVHHKIITSSYGPTRIKKDLEQKGVSDVDYVAALLEYDEQIQEEKLRKIIEKKINSNHTKSNMALKRKLMNDLILDGFSREIINKVISSCSFEENKDIASREYEKIYKKLSRKYQGKDLEFRVKQKMKMLGFNDFEE